MPWNQRVLAATLADQKVIAREIIAGLNLTQYDYNRIIAEINTLNEWDYWTPIRDMVEGLRMKLCPDDIIFYGLEELFYKLSVIWAMENEAARQYFNRLTQDEDLP